MPLVSHVLNQQTNLRLSELFVMQQAAWSVANAATDVAQNLTNRYNDNLASVREALGIDPKTGCQIDFKNGTLTVDQDDVNALAVTTDNQE